MPVLHSLRRAAVVLLLAAATLYAAPARPAAADEPGWTAEPATGAAVTAVRPYFYLAGAPGTVLEDRLALANTTDQERTVSLRGADAYNTADGAFAVRPATPGATAAAGAGSWISFGAATTVKVPPRTRAVVPFTLTVPPASPPGDHPAAVIATEGGHEVGVRVHLRVGGPTLAALTVEDVAVRGRGAAAVIAYTLVNRGNVALTPELRIRVEALFGEPADPPRGRTLPIELLPGQRVELTEPWPGAPALDRVRVTLTVTAPGGARAVATGSRRLVPGGLAGWIGGGLLGLGATTAAALYLVRGRRPEPRPAPAPDGPSAAGPTPPAPHHELTGAAR
ncbi:COG1470 family protein [Streptomyces virginiae]